MVSIFLELERELAKMDKSGKIAQLLVSIS